MKTKSSSSNIKISLKPLFYIAVTITIVVIFGSIANGFRTKSKVARLEQHGQDIFNAHSMEIQSLLKKEENFSEISATIKSINEPEKNLYQVHLVSISSSPQALFQFQGYTVNKRVVTQEEIESIKKYLEASDKADSKIQTGLSDIIYKHSGQEYLVTVIPIKSGAVDIGYLLVNIGLNQNM